MSYPLFLARKLSLATDGRSANPAVRVAVSAVALSVVVMIAAVSIVLGFKREIREKVRGFNSDISLFAMPSKWNDGGTIVTLTPDLKRRLAEVPGVESVSVSVSTPAILKTSDDFKGVYLKSTSSPQTRRFLESNLETGSVPAYDAGNAADENRIVISRKIANQLMLDTASRIDTYFITDEVRVRRFEVAGIYDSHFDAYDDLMVYGSPDFLAAFNNLTPDRGTAILIETSDFSALDDVAADVQDALVRAVAEGAMPSLYSVQTARESGAGYFNWLEMLDVNVIVILTLMMAVGCVTLVSGMLIVILDKRRFIGTLKALGARSSRLRRVFVYLALRIALSGLIAGDLIGVGLLWLQQRFHIIPLDPESYYMDFVPVELSWVSVLMINIGVIAISYIVLILPSRFVARISPAESQRG